MTKKITYAVDAIALLFGLWGVYIRLFEGEQSANYGSYIGWGLWVAMYLFLAGLAAGSYMLATLDYLFNIPQFKGTGKAMLWACRNKPACSRIAATLWDDNDLYSSHRFRM